MFDFGLNEGTVGRALGNTSSILLIDDPQATLRGRVVGSDFDLGPDASEASVTLPKSLGRMVFGSYLAAFGGRVEEPPEITSARKIKEVVTQGRQVVTTEV
jgi:hypothetical protein